MDGERRRSVACRLGATRRGVLGLAAGVGLAAWIGSERAEARAPEGEEDPHVRLVDLALGPGEAPFGGRVPVLVPRRMPPGGAPLVIALHGLGESGDPALGARAWPELYGLVEAYRRLCSPPLAPRSRRGDLPQERIAELNRELAARPLGGLVVACPFTPNPSRAPDRAAHVAAYGRWLVDVVARRVGEQIPGARTEPAHRLLAGCSMGGAVAIDVALGSAGAFGALSLVQSAHGAHRTAAIAAGLARAGAGGAALPTQILTSRGDPFRARNEALAEALAAASAPHELRVLPGPHDQPWLREAGTPEMLLWLDRRRPAP